MTDADCKVCGNSFRVLRQKKYYCSPECSFTAKVDRQEDILACWEWNARRSDRGYGELQVNGKKTRANRFAWEFHNKQKIPDGLLVLHSCDNPPCCNPNHLFLGTNMDNNHDMLRKGRGSKVGNRGNIKGERHGSKTKPESVNRGERNGMSKLDSWDVRFIRYWLSKGYSQSEISRNFNVSIAPVHLIRKNKTWKHIT